MAEDKKKESKAKMREAERPERLRLTYPSDGTYVILPANTTTIIDFIEGVVFRDGKIIDSFNGFGYDKSGNPRRVANLLIRYNKKIYIQYNEAGDKIILAQESAPYISLSTVGEIERLIITTIDDTQVWIYATQPKVSFQVALGSVMEEAFKPVSIGGCYDDVNQLLRVAVGGSVAYEQDPINAIRNVQVDSSGNYVPSGHSTDPLTIKSAISIQKVWDGAAVSAGGTSPSADMSNYNTVGVMISVNAATTITIQVSDDGAMWFDHDELIFNDAGSKAQDIMGGAKYYRLKSSAAATITAAFVGKG